MRGIHKAAQHGQVLTMSVSLLSACMIAWLQLGFGLSPGLGIEASFQDRFPGRTLLSVIERAALCHLQQASVYITVLPATSPTQSPRYSPILALTAVQLAWFPASLLHISMALMQRLDIFCSELQGSIYAAKSYCILNQSYGNHQCNIEVAYCIMHFDAAYCTMGILMLWHLLADLHKCHMLATQDRLDSYRRSRPKLTAMITLFQICQATNVKLRTCVSPAARKSVFKQGKKITHAYIRGCEYTNFINQAHVSVVYDTSGWRRRRNDNQRTVYVCVGKS